MISEPNLLEDFNGEKERRRRWGVVVILERVGLSSHERRGMLMPSIYRFFLSFFPSLFQVCSMQSSLYGKSLPWPTSPQRNSKVSERFLWFPCAKLQSRVKFIAWTSRGHIFLILASIDTILGSMDIYSKRDLQKWGDYANPMVELRVMTILILLSWKIRE